MGVHWNLVCKLWWTVQDIWIQRPGILGEKQLPSDMGVQVVRRLEKKCGRCGADESETHRLFFWGTERQRHRWILVGKITHFFCASCCKPGCGEPSRPWWILLHVHRPSEQVMSIINHFLFSTARVARASTEMEPYRLFSVIFACFTLYLKFQIKKSEVDRT